MKLSSNPGRSAGLLYILISIPGFFALLYIPGKLIVRGDATATAQNIASNELLFRAGIALELLGQILFVLVALALYDLLKDVNRRDAIAMVTLVLIALPVVLLNEAFPMGVLAAVRGGNYFSAVFDKPQREAIAMLLLNLHSGGYAIAGIFWALWLLPLARLIYRSGFIPKVFGVLLPIAATAYLVSSFTALIFPQSKAFTDRWILPLQGFELTFPLWLVVMGAKPKPIRATSAAPAAAMAD